MAEIVRLRGIHKYFGGVKALQGVDFDLREGEVHALVGENGAGKSTLMRVLGGEHTPTHGTVSIDGKEIRFANPQAAIDEGIVVIHQEMALAGDLTVAENIFLGELPGFINWPDLRRRARTLIQSLGFDISPDALAGSLSVAHQQIVEIAKALSKNARVMVFDEPTAVLSVQDAQRLLAIIEGLRAKGVAVIYISHRLDEIMQISDRVTVLKDGSSVETLDRERLSIDDMIRLMVGRPLSDLFGEDVDRPVGAEVLRLENLGRGTAVRNASLTVHAGEIVGIGGLVGAGRTELMRLIFGADKADTGSVYLHGKKLKLRQPKDAVKAGIGLAPESRKEHGVILETAIRINSTMARLKPLTGPLGIIRGRKEHETAEKLAKALRLKAGSIDDPVSSLSGGNQQKVVLAKWFHADVDLLIFDEPTRGVDVGAKSEIYALIKQFAAEGRAVLVVSSEHHELFGLCDRVIVMREGELTGELTKDQYSEENLLKLAMPGVGDAA
ncbi:sugar ABC transporter ATP-binding protein [Marivivens aquimaris]|uniref:sugar ABC transporter ATP-binding protein n=1 Tax=Marivivens aquimaris TaxID=2774876 RepID=UPI00187FEA2A|nr:sugar ABC transporter ATP-binding protein [Marivivens aquimaris]